MDLFNISFSGEILPDFEAEQVQQSFARVFHLKDHARLPQFFSGQTIVLRRNISKEEAARVFAGLRGIGLVVRIERVPAQKSAVAAPRPIAASPPPEQRPEPPRRRRQPGAPNLFDLRPSTSNALRETKENGTQVMARAPMIAAAVVAMALLLVGLRFLTSDQALPASGLGDIVADPGGRVAVQAAAELVVHDRSGAFEQSFSIDTLGMTAASDFDFFAEGSLLIQRRSVSYGGPNWLPDPLRPSGQLQTELLRCQWAGNACQAIVGGLGEASLAVKRSRDQIIAADADANLLYLFDAEGHVLAQSSLPLQAPLSLLLDEGIVYLIQSGSDEVMVLKPDVDSFGTVLDRITLTLPPAEMSGPVAPLAVAWLNRQWWVIMQSRDGISTSAHLYNARWKYLRALPLPSNARPDQLIRWGSTMLMRDRERGVIYRFDSNGVPGRDFGADAVTSSLDAGASDFNLALSLQFVIVLILFIGGAGLMALGTLNSLSGKVYHPNRDDEDSEFDVNDPYIEWLSPHPGAQSRLRILGFLLAGFASTIIIAAFLADISVWGLLAIIVLFSGLGGVYLARLRCASCHLGALGNQLVLVDHNLTYCVGRDSSVQYLGNYIMIDEVIVYLGNGLIEQFATTPLVERFLPLAQRGIKIDRTTLRLKLIHSRHPVILAAAGLAASLICAALFLWLA